MKKVYVKPSLGKAGALQAQAASCNISLDDCY